MRLNEHLSALRIDVLGQDLAIHLLRRHSNFADLARLKQDILGKYLAAGRWKSVSEYIEDDLGEDLSLEEIDSVAVMYVFDFARPFREKAGETPHGYLMRRRVERAKTLLLGTSMSITEIALSCGFASPQRLATVFRKYVGTTPSRGAATSSRASSERTKPMQG